MKEDAFAARDHPQQGSTAGEAVPDKGHPADRRGAGDLSALRRWAGETAGDVHLPAQGAAYPFEQRDGGFGHSNGLRP